MVSEVGTMIYVGAPGVPSGGSAGQVLAKNTAANGDATWAAAGLPTGGATSQVLTKNSATSYDVGWTTPSTGGSSGGTGYYHPWAASTTRAYIAPPLTTGTTLSVTTNSYALWYPARIPNACTVSSVSVYCNAANTTVWIGLYTDVPTATSGGPAVRLTGNQATQATAYSPVTVAANYTFSAATNIWVCFGTTSANNFIVHNSGVLGPGNIMPGGIASVSSGTSTFANVKYNNGYGSGAPTNGAAADMSSVSMTNANFAMPLFAFVIS